MVLADGRKLEERVTVALGAPDNPLGDEALLAKFNELAGMVLSPAKASELADTMLALDRLSDCALLVCIAGTGTRLEAERGIRTSPHSSSPDAGIAVWMRNADDAITLEVVWIASSACSQQRSREQ